MKLILFIAAFCIAWCRQADAQLMPSMGDPTGVNPAFLALLAPAGSFKGIADTVVYDAAGKEWARLPLAVSFCTNKLKLEIQLDQVKSRDLPAFMMESLKAAGMGTISALILPEKRATFLVYPGFQCYLNIPLSKEDALATQGKPTIQKTFVSSEPVRSMSCSKKKVRVSFQGQSLLDATVWEAPEMKGLPAQVEITEPQRRMVLTFRDVHFAPVPAGEFILPAAYTEYKQARDMTFGIMKRIAGTETFPEPAAPN